MKRSLPRTSAMALSLIALVVLAGSALAASSFKNASTALSGGNEVPIRDTHARGAAHVKLSADGMSLEYQLVASNIHNVIMAHIHLQEPGTDPGAANGGIVVWLYPSTAVGPPAAPGGGRHDGILARGTITAANLTGVLAGQPLSALVDAIESGLAYVNVHTNDGMAPDNTGPGDFPGGEIRGQLP
ncbi:MAG TPA: CHRD domain-containing protein [Candidatus Limnocylindria bacterium]|nr:CHRD domain-containing protein [Candidatus Limnocylindria bacterium]